MIISGKRFSCGRRRARDGRAASPYRPSSALPIPASPPWLPSRVAFRPMRARRCAPTVPCSRRRSSSRLALPGGGQMMTPCKIRSGRPQSFRRKPGLRHRCSADRQFGALADMAQGQHARPRLGDQTAHHGPGVPGAFEGAISEEQPEERSALGDFDAAFRDLPGRGRDARSHANTLAGSDVRRVLYRLPMVSAAVSAGETV